MALGKAFIEVHADTAPFARELGRELNRVIKLHEQQARSGGTRIGQNLGQGISSGLNKNSNLIGRSINNSITRGIQNAGNQGAFSTLSKGLIDSIDDGLSGLPAELKVALGAALIVAAPIAGSLIAAVITGAIATGLTLGVAGLGILVASQFTEIQDQFVSTFQGLRNIIVEDARFLFPVLEAGIDLVGDRLLALRPIWVEVFASASKIILPVIDALLGFGENFLKSLLPGLTSLEEFADILGAGLREIGTAAGSVLSVIANDDDAAAALTDLLLLIRDLIYVTGGAIKVFLDLYGAIRGIALAWDSLLFGFFETGFEEFDKSSLKAAESSVFLADGIRGTVAQLEAEEKAIKEVNDVLTKYISDTFGAWDANINFEQTLDDMSETLRKHRGALDLDSQAGRDNQKAIRDAAAALIEQRNRTIELTGNTEHANEVFATNRKRLEDQAAAAGINRTKFRELTDAVLDIPPPQQTGVTQSSINRLNMFITALRSLGAAVAAAGNVGARVASGVQMYANGGIVNRPTLGMIGEAGPEAVLPLSNPARSAQILSQTGLGASLSPTVNVFIGNQQIDAYIDSRVNARMATTARDLAYGGRGV